MFGSYTDPFNDAGQLSVELLRALAEQAAAAAALTVGQGAGVFGPQGGVVIPTQPGLQVVDYQPSSIPPRDTRLSYLVDVLEVVTGYSSGLTITEDEDEPGKIQLATLYASELSAGVVSTQDQTFQGIKTFLNGIVIGDGEGLYHLRTTPGSDHQHYAEWIDTGDAPGEFYLYKESVDFADLWMRRSTNLYFGDGSIPVTGRSEWWYDFFGEYFMRFGATDGPTTASGPHVDIVVRVDEDYAGVRINGDEGATGTSGALVVVGGIVMQVGPTASTTTLAVGSTPITGGTPGTVLVDGGGYLSSSSVLALTASVGGITYP